MRQDGSASPNRPIGVKVFVRMPQDAAGEATGGGAHRCQWSAWRGRNLWDASRRRFLSVIVAPTSHGHWQSSRILSGVTTTYSLTTRASPAVVPSLPYL